jgi:hypothetical protein
VSVLPAIHAVDFAPSRPKKMPIRAAAVARTAMTPVLALDARVALTNCSGDSSTYASGAAIAVKVEAEVDL